MTEAAEIVSRLDAFGLKRSALRVDSRNVMPSDIFIAMPGTQKDGRSYIATAVAKGAGAVVREKKHISALDTSSLNIPYIDVENLATKLGEIANEYYERPSHTLKIFGVTGTNGKTSIVNWLQQAMNAQGISCGALGTLGASFNSIKQTALNTTPDAASVHETLHRFRQAGAAAAAIEVSSHALDQHRVGAVAFDTVVLSNLTQDHLDYHCTMAEYAAAKVRLFTEYAARHRIVNADDALGEQLIAKKLPDVLSYGFVKGDLRGRMISLSSDGMVLEITGGWGTCTVRSELIGCFNAYNLLAVATTLLTTGTPIEALPLLLGKLIAAPGRLQRVSLQQLAKHSGPTVYVDYAHTPDALLNVLTALRESASARLIVVFGCGGDRDRSKRPLMGKVAAEQADLVYVTSDNPRNEAPEQIIAEICAGIDAVITSGTKVKVSIVVDRDQAIHEAINEADPSDVIVIAGKGHEDYQEIAQLRHSFSDIDVALDALSQRSARIERGDDVG